MRTGSARVGLLLMLASGAAAAQNQPSPPPTSTPAAAAAGTPSPAWRPFQEFAFLVGSWSGSAESGARLGGRVARFAPEFTQNYFVHRGSTILATEDGREETIEEVGYFAYDREKRRYVASYFFSTGICATFEVEIAPEGVRLASRELVNAEAGTKVRMLFARKPDGELWIATDLASPGKDFVPWLVSALKKK
jgi:hypothetical protein